MATACGLCIVRHCGDGYYLNDVGESLIKDGDQQIRKLGKLLQCFRPNTLQHNVSKRMPFIEG